MASLNTLKTKFGFLISGLIAVVLVIFALNIDSNTFVDQPSEDEINGPAVLSIADQEVKYNEYARLRELYSAASNHEAGASLAVVSLVNTYFESPAYASIGVFATSAEVEAKATEKYRQMRQMYAASVDPAQLDAGIQSMWAQDQHTLPLQIQAEKFEGIMNAGHYLNKLEVAEALRGDKLTFDGAYVSVPYASIKDADVNVTDEEIAAYYEANRKENPNYNARSIRYVRFERNATAEDKAAIEAEVMALDAKVKELKANGGDIKAAVRAAGGKIQSNYVVYDDKVKAHGPELKSNTWTACYILSEVTAPESFDVELAYYENIADAEKAVEELKANGGDFKKLESAKDVQSTTINFTQLSVGETKDFVGRKAGDIFVFSNAGMGTVVKINKVGATKRYAQTANLNREVVPSDATNRKVLAEIEGFTSKMGNTVESFDAAAKESKKPAVPATVARPNLLKGGAVSVPGIGNSTNMARWTLGAEVGETKQFVIDGVTYVAIVEKIDTEKYELRNDAAIRRKIAAEKKYEMIASKVNTLDEAKAFEGAKSETFTGVKFADNNIDAHLVGAIAATTETGKVVKVQGTSAAYIFVVNKINGEVDPSTYAAERTPLTDKAAGAYNNAYTSFLEKANIEDNRTDSTF